MNYKYIDTFNNIVRNMPAKDLRESFRARQVDVTIHYDAFTDLNMDWANVEKLFDQITTNSSNIQEVIYSGPATIVIWGDGDKTVVKCSKNDRYDPEKALAIAFMTKVCGKAGVRRIMKEYLPKNVSE